MKTVQQLILELANFPVDKSVRFFSESTGSIVELKIAEYDQDQDGNPTFFLEKIK